MELFKLFGTIAIKNSQANEAIDETTGKATQSESEMSKSFKKIGMAVTTYLSVDKVVDFGKKVVEAAANVSAEASAFEQIMGGYSDTAQKKMNEVADNTGMVASRLTPYMTSMTAKFKGLGFDIGEATDLASDGLNLAADAAAFWDMSLDDSMSHLNSFINGSYEGGEAIGLFANDTQMASYAVSQGLVKQTKDWASLDEATKQATRLEYAQNMMKASGAVGQAAKESSQYANVQANLTEKLRQFNAQIGEPLLENVVNPAMQKLSGLVDKASVGFQILSAFVSEHKGLMIALASVIGIVTAAIIAFNVAQSIKAAMNAAEATSLGALIAVKFADAAATMAAFAPYLLITAAIAALIAIIVLLVKNWDKVKEVATKVWNKVKEIWGKAGEWFKSKVIDPIVGFFTGLAESLKAVWDGIKSVWDTVADWFSSNVIDPIVNFFTGLWEKLKTIWNGICNVVSFAVQLIANIISFAVDIITFPWRMLWEGIRLVATIIWNAIGDKVLAAINKIKEIITTVMTAIKDFFSEAWNGIKEVVTTVMTAISDFLTPIWETIKSVITTVIEAIKSAVEAGFNFIKEKIVYPILEAYRKVEIQFEQMKAKIEYYVYRIKEKVREKFEEIKEKITTPINKAKEKVSEIFNNIKTSVSEKVNAIKAKVENIFNKIKSAIEKPINKARDTVKAALDKIKGFFDKLKLKFPNIKLPHFSIKGSFSLKPPSVPKLSVDWYAKAMKNAMLLNQPTIFGVNPNGNLMGGGEAGQEVVAGSSTLMAMIRNAVQNENAGIIYYLDKLISMLAQYFPEILGNLEREMVLDDGTLVAKITPKVDKKLGDINRMKERGQ